MSQDTGKFRNTLDQFYTSPTTARICIDILHKHVKEGVFIEPSAGKGVFLDLVPSAIGYDIDPQDPRILKADFLTITVPDHSIVFGNPPFGRQSSLAKKFIKHSAKTADIIAFILPRSFQKDSMQKAFPLTFHLVEEFELPENSFLVNDTPYNVPCVFQVWKRYDSDRKLQLYLHPVGFHYVSADKLHHLVFRRVGVNAGKCSLPGNHSSQSHYFIQLENPEMTNIIIQKASSHIFPSNTTGPRSLSKFEATTFLCACLSNSRR
jgi:hypothetical protein